MVVLIRIGILLMVLMLAGCQGTSWGERFAQQVGYGSLPAPPPHQLPIDRPQPILRPQISPIPSIPSPVPTDLVPTDMVGTVASEFQDLDRVPFARQAIADLGALGVWQGIPGPAFEPELSVRRREFARWLVLANNALSRDTPTRLIRLSGAPQRPLFLDVPEDDQDFEVIQALGSLGIIRGDHRQEFRPNSLLTRADLIAMKVPLDLPPGGLSGSLDELQQAWGFNDSDQIPSYVWPALIGDRQLGEESTILRVFGVIRLFNAQNPVSRAEVALALSRFHHPLRTSEQVLATPQPTPSPLPTQTPTSNPAEIPAATPTVTPTVTPMETPDPTPLPLPSPSPPAGRFVQP